MATYYMDYENGDDETSETPLGWWSVAFTGGNGTEPAEDEEVTGGTSSSTANVTVVDTTEGVWEEGSAGGTMYFYGKDGTFQAEEVSGDACTFNIGADFTYCAWKTITDGATEGRIAAGDIICIAKSPAPTSIGNATWTDGSEEVELAGAQTANIDMCDDSWTANGSGDTTVSTTAGKEANCNKFTLDASVQTDIMQAYYATGELDLSGYQKISFWFYNRKALSDDDTFIIKLCSDVAGATPVDEFPIPAVATTSKWHPVTVARTGGGNLGASIKSVAIYSGGTAPTGSDYYLIDDIIACTTDGLNLQSLISKNSTEQGGTEQWCPIKSINDTTIVLDTAPDRGYSYVWPYYGDTETVTTYKRETIKTPAVYDECFEVQESGEDGNNIEFQFGYDTDTNEQSGESFFDGQVGQGTGLQVRYEDYITINHYCPCRYSSGLKFEYADGGTVTNIFAVGNGTWGLLINTGIKYTIGAGIIASHNYAGLAIAEVYQSTVGSIIANSCHYEGVLITSRTKDLIVESVEANNTGHLGLRLNDCVECIVQEATCTGCDAYGVRFDSSNGVPHNNKIYNLTTSDNGDGGIECERGYNYLFNASIAEETEVDDWEEDDDARVYSWNHDQTANNHWIFCYGGTINAQTDTRHTASGIAWKFTPESTRDSGFPLWETLAEIAVNSGAEVTVKCWCKKDHATNIAASLVCRGGQLTGVSEDVTDTKADDTDWEELSISFTPTQAGVIKVEGRAWYASGASYAYFDDLTITQA